jgi:hypothetical protein
MLFKCVKKVVVSLLLNEDSVNELNEMDYE